MVGYWLSLRVYYDRLLTVLVVLIGTNQKKINQYNAEKQKREMLIN